jgi:hypothetical protein
MASPAVANALASVSAIRGISQSFVDFTTKLVSDVMNALVASSISQMRAYADLVGTLERGLSAYKAQVSTPQAIIAWLESRIPETGSGPAALKAPTDKLSQHSADTIRDLYATKLVSILGPASGKPGATPTSVYVLPKPGGSVGLSAEDMLSAPTSITASTALLGLALDAKDIPKTDGTGAIDYTVPANALAVDSTTEKNIPIDLLSAVYMVMRDDAEQSYSQLDSLVKMGMIRIVVPDGHILTRMTFQMDTSDSSQQSSADVYGSSFAVSGSAGASWGWGSASIKASYSSFSTHLAQQSSQTSTDIQVAMMGEVLVNFKSDYFPLLPSQAKP